MDEWIKTLPSKKLLIIISVVLALIGASVLILIIVFLLSLEHTVYPLPTGELMPPFTSTPVNFPAEILLFPMSVLEMLHAAFIDIYKKGETKNEH